MQFKKILLQAWIPWSLFFVQSQHTLYDGQKLRIGVGLSCEKVRIELDAKVARSEEARQTGLSHRKNPLAKNEAMLFVFSPPEQVRFWMKDTWIPLDLAFFDTDGKFKNRLKLKVEKDSAHPKKLYPSQGVISAGVEAAPGAFKNLTSEKDVFCVFQ